MAAVLLQLTQNNGEDRKAGTLMLTAILIGSGYLAVLIVAVALCIAAGRDKPRG